MSLLSLKLFLVELWDDLFKNPDCWWRRPFGSYGPPPYWKQGDWIG